MSQFAAWPAQVALMSIRPVYADRILSGEKRFEIRRRAVRLDPNAIVVIYSSAPVSAIVGTFFVKQVHVGPPGALWRRYSRSMGVSRDAYEEYLQGVELACAIEIGAIARLREVPLAELRSRDGGFRPPQSYTFLWPRPADGASCRDSAVRREASRLLQA